MKRYSKYIIILIGLTLLIPGIALAKKKTLDIGLFKTPPNFSSEASDSSYVAGVRANSKKRILYNTLKVPNYIILPPPFEWNTPVCSDKNPCTVTIYAYNNEVKSNIFSQEDITTNSFTYEGELSSGLKHHVSG